LPGTVIYENPGALSRFFLVGRTQAAGDMQAALATLRARDFDPRATAIVEGSAPITGSAADGVVQVVEYSPRQVVIETNAAAPAFLVTSEAAYPGWHAWIDGVPHPIVLTNVAFRGLPVPPGTHRVKMRFDPAILVRGAWLTLAAALALAAAVWFGDN
jgi:Bacterial membrane protein YfhO